MGGLQHYKMALDPAVIRLSNQPLQVLPLDAPDRQNYLYMGYSRALSRWISCLQDRLRTDLLAALIRSLEGKHGNIARSLELRAAEVAMVAAQQEQEAIKMRGLVRAGVYTPDAVRALEGYERHLRDVRSRVGEEINGLERMLAEYGVVVDGGGGKGDPAKERTMREMGRVYGGMRREMEEVGGDLRRLGRA